MDRSLTGDKNVMNPSKSTHTVSKKPYLQPKQSELYAGIDEVGRGALFGPVVAAAVILSEAHAERLVQLGVTDSKKISAQRREVLFEDIQQSSIACAIGLASVAEIDRLNILQASLLAMKRAIARLSHAPTLCLVDGNQTIPNLTIPQETIIKGDESSLAIASASILAKVWRDRLITRMAQRFPQYDLASNKGYGTKKHRDAIRQWGPSRYHRLSFKPCQVSNADLSPPAAMNKLSTRQNSAEQIHLEL